MRLILARSASVTIVKKDATDSTTIAGAVFELSEGAAVMYTSTTSGTDGICTFAAPIAWGTYTVHERMVPQDTLRQPTLA